MTIIYNPNFLKALTGDTGNNGVAEILTGVAAGGGSVGTGGQGGVILLFNAGSSGVPADVDTALTMTASSGDVTNYTLLGRVLANPGSNYGVTFDNYNTAGFLPKKASETWHTGALTAWVAGARAIGSLTVDFIRFVKNGDDGHSASGSNPRMQASVGIGGLVDILLANNVVTASGGGGTDFTISQFQLTTQ